MEKVSEAQLLNWALKGNQEAINFCRIIFQASQMLDDLYDGDNSIEKETINNVFWNIMVSLPKNAFYLDHLNELTPIIQRSLSDWFDANTLEHGSEHDKTIAFILRDSVSGLLIDCAYLVGGYAWGREVGATIRKQIHDETLTDYIQGLGPVERTIKSSIDYYESFFDEYTKIPVWQAGMINGSSDQTLAYILNKIGDVKGKTVLDMGSGIGAFSQKLNELGASVISVVNSHKCAEYQRSKYDFKVIEESYLDTGLPDGCADKIIFLESFCYELPDDTMKEVYRLLKPGGMLFIKCIAPISDDPLPIAHEDEIWKTKNSSLQSIVEAVKEKLQDVSYGVIANCDHVAFTDFLSNSESLYNHHKDSRIGAFPFYSLVGIKPLEVQS